MLAHLPALCALTLPTAASYARMVDSAWTGGTFVSWGLDAREVPLRACGRLGARHFEFRPLDGTANPYVALAGVLGAGARGIAVREQLGVRPCGAHAPAEMDANERPARGIVARLPRTLPEARARLAQDKVLMEMLGGVGEVWAGMNKVSSSTLGERRDLIVLREGAGGRT
jgi:glutamine synthetase